LYYKALISIAWEFSQSHGGRSSVGWPHKGNSYLAQEMQDGLTRTEFIKIWEENCSYTKTRSGKIVSSSIKWLIYLILNLVAEAYKEKLTSWNASEICLRVEILENKTLTDALFRVGFIRCWLLKWQANRNIHHFVLDSGVSISSIFCKWKPERE